MEMPAFPIISSSQATWNKRIIIATVYRVLMT